MHYFYARSFDIWDMELPKFLIGIATSFADGVDGPMLRE
jgi:hypothetical protein